MKLSVLLKGNETPTLVSLILLLVLWGQGKWQRGDKRATGAQWEGSAKRMQQHQNCSLWSRPPVSAQGYGMTYLWGSRVSSLMEWATATATHVWKGYPLAPARGLESLANGHSASSRACWLMPHPSDWSGSEDETFWFERFSFSHQ